MRRGSHACVHTICVWCLHTQCPHTVEVTLEPEAPKGLGARIKEAAAKLASPLLGGESPSASAPAPNAVPATAPKPPAPVGPSADEGNKVVSGIMETVLQSRRDRVKDAVAAAGSESKW